MALNPTNGLLSQTLSLVLVLRNCLSLSVSLYLSFFLSLFSLSLCLSMPSRRARAVRSAGAPRTERQRTSELMTMNQRVPGAKTLESRLGSSTRIPCCRWRGTWTERSRRSNFSATGSTMMTLVDTCVCVWMCVCVCVCVCAESKTIGPNGFVIGFVLPWTQEIRATTYNTVKTRLHFYKVYRWTLLRLVYTFTRSTDEKNPVEMWYVTFFDCV